MNTITTPNCTYIRATSLSAFFAVRKGALAAEASVVDFPAGLLSDCPDDDYAYCFMTESPCGTEGAFVFYYI